MATITKTIGVSQDYATVAAWEADLDDGGVYDAGDDAVGTVIDGDLVTESLTIDGGTSVGGGGALNSITLTSTAGGRGDGTAAGEKAVLLVNTNSTNCIDNISTTVPVTISGLTFKKTSNTFGSSTGMIAITSANADVIIEKCLIYSTDDSGNDRGIYITAAGADLTVRNCVIFNWRTELIHDNRAATGRALYYNLSMWDGNSDGFEKSNTGSGNSGTIKNCISAEGGGQDFDFGSSPMTHDYNESNDATATGANSSTGITAANEFVNSGAGNLTTKAGATALAAGIGPTGDANVPEDDINDVERSGATCDRGAFEITSGEEPEGTAMQINIGDAWKDIAAMQINIGDSWKAVAGAQINIGDAWKEIF